MRPKYAVGLFVLVKYDQSFDGGGNLLNALQQTPVYDGQPWPTVSIPYSHGWLTQQTATWSTRPNASASFTVSTMHQNAYGYDLPGQRLSNTVTDNLANVRTESYGYDNLNRLTSVDYGDGQTQGYSFDAMGNRATKTDSSTGNESYGYDAANRLTSRTIGTTSHTVTSDANGNTLSDSERTNTWDSQNRLVSCTSGVSGSTQTSTFTYGSDGLRRRGTVTASDGTSTRTDYIYDGTMMVEQIVQHFDGTGSALDSPTVITYLQGPQGPLYRKSSAVSDPSWYVYDGLGSVVGEVDVNGNLTASKEFDVYGLTRSVTGTPTTRQGFVGGLGHESDDETGLIYMRARYYDPGTGRFISEDPSGSGGNWFVYANDNPVNNVDADGRVAAYIAAATIALLQACGFTPTPGTLALLLSCTPSQYVDYVADLYASLGLAQISYNRNVATFRKLRMDGEAAGLYEEAASAAYYEQDQMGKSISCSIAKIVLPILVIMSAMDDDDQAD